jgi:hypothetical protein
MKVIFIYKAGSSEGVIKRSRKFYYTKKIKKVWI